jgi:hypothetical protein
MSYIEPVDKTITQTIVRFSLDIIELILNTSATFRVLCYDANNKLIDSKFVSLEGTDYSNWGNDDQYIVQFVSSQLGFILVNNL